jgi:hypothetical protein
MSKNDEVYVDTDSLHVEGENATAAPRKSAQVSTTVSAEYFDGLEDHRWTARKKMTEIVREALDDYVAKHGVKVDGSAPHAKA